ncbi:thymidylate kinase [Synechococcus sp. PCC 7335]|uniref:dTMP kinase n=1 Tax=Synechococcus sp. (strain ATCC 29403 / PCC 7335) TaxID=91464 RepID=UPI00017ECE18|nr:dTMP kinase [Synechococcus sp. PCC 7335]EDX87747.1 thymidylate kinase [Synechococcus sp. PCC 7335]
MRGKLIVFEGGEGCGKTTQLQRLYDWIVQNKSWQLLLSKGHVAGVKMTREPGGTVLGKQLRQLLLNESKLNEPRSANDALTPVTNKAELLLYAADRAQHVEEVLLPWLEAGYWVLCDRYIDSTVAYQGYGRQLDLSLITTLNQIATAGLRGDLTLWLNVPPEVGLDRMRARGQADRIEQASMAFHQRVHDGFAMLAKENATTVSVAGDRTADEVAMSIQQVLQRRLKQWYPEWATSQ